MTLSLTIPSKKYQNEISSTFTLFKVNMESVWTRHIAPWKYYSEILGNKDKRWNKMIAITLSSGYIIWKDTLNRYISRQIRTEKLIDHMEDKSITGLVYSCTAPSKLAIIFNISPCTSVATWILQYNLPSLLSNME